MRKGQISVELLLSVMMLFAMVSLAQGNVPLSWGVERIRSYCVWDNDNWNRSSAWDVDLGANAGQNVTIAVIDTGVDYNDTGYHPDLAANIRGGAGFLHNLGNYYPPDTSNFKDYDGHGTQVVGIIAAIVNGAGANQSGIIGAAPQVNIYALKFESSRMSTDSVYEVAAAINYSVDNLGANIISMSLGTFLNDTTDAGATLHNSCNYAYGKGALLFVAVGDDGGPISTYPELYYNVSAVGATDQNDNRASFSDYGPKLDFVAPGVNISTTTINYGYANVNGTSFAVAFADATAALILNSKVDTIFDFHGGGPDGKWENDETWAKMVLNGTLRLGGTLFKDNYTGWGLVNPWLATQRPIGDLNQDNHTDGKDLGMVRYAFGSFPGSPTWDPRADVNIDKKVDGKDLGIVAWNFGKGDP
jgi:subtilisin family serine protease